MNSDLVFGGFVALLAGILGGTAVEFLLKLLFAPAYGMLLLKRPLTVLGFLNDSEDVIGLSARFTAQKQSLKLTFENDELHTNLKVQISNSLITNYYMENK